MNQDAPDPLQLNLFGGVRLLRAGEPVAVGVRRGLALLAYLALHDGPLQREHAATLLWPDAEPTAGRTRLRRLLYRLESVGRRRLFDTREGRLGLLPGALTTDLQAFQRVARQLVGQGVLGVPLDVLADLARAACAPLLEGLDVGSDSVDDWVQMMRIEHQHLLTRTLVRIAELQQARAEPAMAEDMLETLLRLDPHNEPAYRLLMDLASHRGDLGAVEAIFARCADALRAEFGCRPGSATEQTYADAVHRASNPSTTVVHRVAPAPRLRFVNGPHGTVAYALSGTGPQALVVMPGFVSHIEIGWEHPVIREVLEALGRRFTVLTFDRRGVGLSERLNATGTAAAMADDVVTLLDAAGIDQAWLFGSSEGAPAAVHLAATRPARIIGLLLFGALAKGSHSEDHPWALRDPAFELWMQRLVSLWGGPADIETFAPSVAADPWNRAWWARLLRQAASPGSLRHILQGLRDTDVRPDLAHVTQPTLVMHRRGDRAVKFEAGQALAAAIPHARFVPMDGEDHCWWAGNAGEVLDAMLEFVGQGAGTVAR